MSANASSDQIMQTTTIDDLNQLTTSQVCLIMLRCLNTSDLTFHYMLYKPETLLNIQDECSHLLAMDIQDHESDSGLSPEEISEFNDHLQTLYEYAQSQL